MVVAAVVIVVASAYAASRMGGEFIPSLDEGDIAVHAMRIPGTSLTQSVDLQAALEKRVRQIPEVKDVFARTGTAEVATDAMPPSISDGYVMLKPRAEWPDPARPKSDLVEEIERCRQRDSGQQLRIHAADPAARQRTDLRRPQRHRHQDIRRRPRHRC